MNRPQTSSCRPDRGLLTASGAVPLTGVRIAATLCGPCVEVCVTQHYANHGDRPIEAVYVFPLDAGAAVCGFSGRIGDREIVGRVEERDAAFAAYDDAMIAGDTAILLDRERPDIFTASLGSLHPGETAELSIRYVALAQREGSAYRLTVPTTVSPRYVPAEPPAVGQPDGERVNPERWLHVPYGLTLRVEVDCGDLVRIESPSHPIRTELGARTAAVDLSQSETALDRDFVLVVEPAAPSAPFARAAVGPDGSTAVMVSLLPGLRAEDARRHEVIFLLDCSGSMDGTSIEQARRALALCIRALRPGDTFNIVRFGSQFTALWPRPALFDEGTLYEATQYVDSVQADLGGTEIAAPLDAILRARPDRDRARQVLVLTDGQVSNEDQVIALVARHAATARIFSFGIGAGASAHLVRGVARASRGAAEMIFPNERIEPKVLRTFGRLRTPTIVDAALRLGPAAELAPTSLPPVFADEALIAFARIEGPLPSEAELLVAGRSYTVPVTPAAPALATAIPLLWARERISELEGPPAAGAGSLQADRHGERNARARARLVELSCRYGLVSSATSFVAVMQRPTHERNLGPTSLVRVPVALTAGWGAGEAAAVGGAAQSPPAARRRHARGGQLRGAPARSAASLDHLIAPPARGMPARKSMYAVEDAGASASFEEQDAPVSGAPVSGYGAPDRLFEVLMTQRADGSFEPSDALSAWLGTERSEKLALAVDQHGAAVAVTAAVIALLEREEPLREPEWRAAASKARAWLAARALAPDLASWV